MAREPAGPRRPASQVRPTKKAATTPPLSPPAAAPHGAARASTRSSLRAPRPAPRAPTRLADARARAPELYARLEAAYPDARCELDYRNAFELLCATILSAQCTDKRVNMVTPALFARYPDAAALADARQEDVEEIVRTTGFFRNKAKNLVAMARALVDRHGGAVPRTMDELVVLPGVGRKTANVILGNAYGLNEGVTVDTHVQRLAARLGLTGETDPVKIEQALMPLFARERWAMLSHLLIFHGRRTCDARRPRCGDCALADLCPSAAPG